MSVQDDLKTRFMAIRFSIWDLHLYLDTHPDDAAAQALLEKYRAQYEEISQAYVEKYGPYTSADSPKAAAWLKAPWPWDNTRGNC
ncbi:MAG: spore coat protein CotJB [Clostridia bacterium]|nr:spore coat protein CotJB [Clostridia bacterium]